MVNETKRTRFESVECFAGHKSKRARELWVFDFCESLEERYVNLMTVL